MSNGDATTPGFSLYGTSMEPWSPWTPKKDRSSINTADTAKLYLNDATSRAGYNDKSTYNWVNSLTWNDDIQFFQWAGNTQPVPVVFFSDQSINKDGTITSTGKPLGSTYIGRDGIATGSPAELNEFTQSIIKQYTGKELELKKLLQEKNYLQGEYAAKSLAFGNAPDPYFQQAIKAAALDGTVANLGRINAGEKKIQSFSDWLRTTQKAPGTSAFGTSSTSTRIVHQKFDPADYDIAIDQLFQQTVGRGASKEELDFFVGQLQSYADANPQTVVTKTVGNTSTSTTTGGVSGERAASMMRESALANPEAEQYNKATKYLNYFTEALNAPVRLG